MDEKEKPGLLTVISTLKGPLSVRKLMPGTYLSQTGNPLQRTQGQNKSNQFTKETTNKQ